MATRRVNFLLTEANVARLNTYKSYAPVGFKYNLSELLNQLLAAHLDPELSRLEEESHK
jgi:hypothetical protein